MAGKDTNYQIVYRGDYLEYFHSGGWVFFQRPKEAGGGFWLGRTYDFVLCSSYRALFHFMKASFICSS